MNSLPVLPIVMPAAAAALLLVLRHPALALSRAVTLACCIALALCAAALATAAADGSHMVYALGDWPAPFGIVLVVDRLSALMLVLAALLALGCAWYAAAGWDARGPHFHPLFLLQLMGINGAFLTGDLFNLFVFFEVLLIASYCLLLHGLGQARVSSALHYVVINLLGSALFLVAAALLYGVAGTLNMAHLAERYAQAGAGDRVLMRSAGLLLVAVFAIKAALFPMSLWLPRAYTAAGAPVAALFSIMTKVGIYAIARVALLIFGPEDFTDPWLLPAALLTLTLGTVGALGAERLATLAAYLVINSVGTMLTGLAVGGSAGVSAALYYLAHSVFVLAALFLLAELVGRQRSSAGDRLRAGHALLQPAALGLAFLVAAAMAAGLPPLSGFVGKLLLLQASAGGARQAAVWATVLVTSLLTVLACARAGSILFWKQTAPHAAQDGEHVRANEALPLGLLLAAAMALVVLAAPVTRYINATAQQLLAPRSYVEAVLPPQVDRQPRNLHERRPP